MRIVIFANRFLVPFTKPHGAWINACASGRHCKSFWLHILFTKLEVDVVSGECQSFIIKVFSALLSILCPSVHSVDDMVTMLGEKR